MSVKSLCQGFREAFKRVEYLVWISLWHDVEEGEAQHTFFLLIQSLMEQDTEPQLLLQSPLNESLMIGVQAAQIYTMTAHSKMYSMSNINTVFIQLFNMLHFYLRDSHESNHCAVHNMCGTDRHFPLNTHFPRIKDCISWYMFWFSLASLPGVSLKGSASICVCVCVLTSSGWHHMHSPYRLLSQALSCLFTIAQFLPKFGEQLGDWMRVIRVYQIQQIWSNWMAYQIGQAVTSS